MLIAICVFMCAVTQVVGLGLIALALRPEKSHAEVLEDATMNPTISSDYGGLV